MNYKPFDLETAKRGDPVITRCGHKVRILCFNIKHECYPIAFAWIDGAGIERVDTASKDGFCSGYPDGRHDLVMAPKVKTFWTNVYKDNGMLCTGGSLFTSKERAMKFACDPLPHRKFITTVPIEIEV